MPAKASQRNRRCLSQPKEKARIVRESNGAHPLKPTTRSTRQRRSIRAVFERLNRPLGPQDVLQEVSQEVEGVGIATVYRTINTLFEEGVLVKVDLPGESSRYEMAGKDHHHHFRCQQCEQVFELAGCLANVKSLVPPGFRMTGHEILIFGQCSQCRKAA